MGIVAATSTLQRFAVLPRRLFLDSSTLQTIMGYGEFIWENVEPSHGDRAYRLHGFVDDLDALRMILRVNQRAALDIVVSPKGLAEVNDKRDAAYSTIGGLALPSMPGVPLPAPAPGSPRGSMDMSLGTSP
jgi:hypothetical protein